MPTELGTRVRTLRKSNQLTLEALATKIGSSKSYIWEIENKDVARPSAERLTKIARALQTTVEYLLEGSDGVDPDEARDAAFFRKYREQDKVTKKRLQQLLDILDED